MSEAGGGIAVLDVKATPPSSPQDTGVAAVVVVTSPPRQAVIAMHHDEDEDTLASTESTARQSSSTASATCSPDALHAGTSDTTTTANVVLPGAEAAAPNSVTALGKAVAAAGRRENVLEWHIKELQVRGKAATRVSTVIDAITTPGGTSKPSVVVDDDDEDEQQGQAGGGGMALFWAAAKKRRLLSGIVGRTRSGEMTAVMGPSGCGKTTLIECLSLRNREFEGALRLNGKSADGEYFTQAGLVHQKEMLFGFMTVREHLTFAAAVKLGRYATTHEKKDRITQVMRLMGLADAAETHIGGTDPIFLKKGLSGGERRRLVIATELLQSPAILFLDEPTTGLDSVRSEDVVAALHALTGRGIIVITSIHMPSGEAVSLFSHLMLLTADGRVAYHGPMARAIDHFEALGFPLPPVYSAVDFFLRLVSKDTTKSTHDELSRLDRLVASCHDSSHQQHGRPAVLPCDQTHKIFHGVSGLKVSHWELVKLNVWRGWLQTTRDLTAFLLWGVVFAINGFLLGIIFYHQAREQWRSLTGILFTAVVAVLLICALPNVVKFPLEWSKIVREYMSGGNALGPYLLAKIVADLPFLYGPILMATLLYWMTGMAPDVVSFLRFVGALVLVEQAAVGVGLLVSSLSANPVVGFYLVPCFLLPMILFSGLLYQRSSVPFYLQWMQELSVVNFGFSALLSLTVDGLPDLHRRVILTFTEVDPTHLPQDLTRLAVIAFSGYCLAYLSLRLRVTLSSTTNV